MAQVSGFSKGRNKLQRQMSEAEAVISSRKGLSVTKETCTSDLLIIQSEKENNQQKTGGISENVQTRLEGQARVLREAHRTNVCLVIKIPDCNIHEKELLLETFPVPEPASLFCRHSLNHSISYTCDLEHGKGIVIPTRLQIYMLELCKEDERYRGQFMGSAVPNFPIQQEGCWHKQIS